MEPSINSRRIDLTLLSTSTGIFTANYTLMVSLTPKFTNYIEALLEVKSILTGKDKIQALLDSNKTTMKGYDSIHLLDRESEMYDLNKFVDKTADKDIRVNMDRFKNNHYDQRLINENVNKSLSNLIKGINDYHSTMKDYVSRNRSMPNILVSKPLDKCRRNSLNYLNFHTQQGLTFPSLSCQPSRDKQNRRGGFICNSDEQLSIFKSVEKTPQTTFRVSTKSKTNMSKFKKGKKEYRMSRSVL